MNTTTVHSRSPLLNRPDEVQNAYNVFAIAVKRFTESPTRENEIIMENAKQKTYEIEDLYREGRALRLEHARAKVRWM